MRVPTVLTFIALFSSLVLAGCITAETGADDDEPIEPTYEDIVHEETVSMTISVETGVHPEETDLPGEATLTIPDRSSNLTFTPSWEIDTNSFRLVFDRPDGKSDTVDTGADGDPIAYADPAIGTYTLHLRTQGIVREDTVTIQATYEWIERVYDENAPSAMELGGISVVQDGDMWKATLTTQTQGAADAFDIGTSSGDIAITSADGDTASSVITLTAQASDKERARAAVREAKIENSIRDGILTTKATWQPNTGGDDGIRRNIQIDVVLPDGLGGSVGASSGDITIDGVTFGALDVDVSSGVIAFGDGVAVDRLVLETSSGDATGTVRLSGDTQMDTSSGDLRLTLIPTKSFRLTAETSSGEVALKLRESSDIAYDLELTTSSGDLSASMDEAELEHPDPEDDERAFLRTADGNGRAIQVTGSVATSSGDQAYTGA
ncbi:MAG: DUF4097 domain-containing protein [Euryarchaeota archaeon]|nr:DUF4097 domain-containing protein [Euryarchaeota archaeon]